MRLQIQARYQRTYGIHRWRLSLGQTVTSLSAPSWEEFAQLLNELQDQDQVVVSPELITIAGLPWEQLQAYQTLVNQRIALIADFSRKKPLTTFIIGTPTFSGDGKPKNSALVIKNGKIIGITHKRINATRDELQAFEMMPEEPPILLSNNTGVLICADLGMAALVRSQDWTKDRRFLKLLGSEYLFGKTLTPIHANSQTLIVLACWGVRDFSLFKVSDSPDEHFQIQLRNIAWGVLRDFPNLCNIVVIDRLPRGNNGFTPQRPFNALIQRDGDA